MLTIMRLLFRLATLSAFALFGSGCSGESQKTPGAGANGSPPSQMEYKPEVVSESSQTEPSKKKSGSSHGEEQSDRPAAPQAGVFNVYVNSTPPEGGLRRRGDRERRPRVLELRERRRRQPRRPIVVEMPDSDSDDSSSSGGDSQSDSGSREFIFVTHDGHRHRIVLPAVRHH